MFLNLKAVEMLRDMLFYNSLGEKCKFLYVVCVNNADNLLCISLYIYIFFFFKIVLYVILQRACSKPAGRV